MNEIYSAARVRAPAGVVQGLHVYMLLLLLYCCCALACAMLGEHHVDSNGSQWSLLACGTGLCLVPCFAGNAAGADDWVPPQSHGPSMACSVICTCSFAVCSTVVCKVTHSPAVTASCSYKQTPQQEGLHEACTEVDERARRPTCIWHTGHSGGGHSI
jgi:hypothetical protein